MILNSNNFLYPKHAQAELPTVSMLPQETDTIVKLRTHKHANIEYTKELVTHWQGDFIWLQGPRGSQHTRILTQRITETAEHFANTESPDTLLLITPYTKQAEQWRLWAQERKIRILTQTPESFAHNIVSEFYKELGYTKPPQWEDAKMKIIIQDIWEDAKKQMDALIDNINTTPEEKACGNQIITIHKTKTPNNYIQYVNQFQQRFFTKVYQRYQEEAAINTELAHFLLSNLLETRPDIRNTITRRIDALFVEEPEAMDTTFFDWFTRLAFRHIYVTSIYSIKGNTGLFPHLYNHRNNPDGKDLSPNKAIFGIPCHMWKEPHTYIPLRNQYHETIKITTEPKHKGTITKFDQNFAETILNENLFPKARIVHLTLEPDNTEPKTGLWIAQNITRFHSLKLQTHHYFQPERKQETHQRQFHLFANENPHKNLQVFLAVPPITYAAHPQIEEWRNYLTITFEDLRNLNLDVKYLSLIEGPIENPPIRNRIEAFNNTVWIGTPLAANGCEFDLVIIPRLESQHWPQSESTGWDWLDLCASKARYATIALARPKQLPPYFADRLPQEMQKTPITQTQQAKLYFEPLFKTQTISNAFGPSLE
jgi:superfamily I DNA/RNA helicase